MSASGEEGSVLVDALVAVGVITLTVVLAGAAVGDAALRTRAAEQARLAELEARSRLDEAGADIPLVVGRASGTDGPLSWSVVVTPAPRGAGRLLDVTASAGPPGAPPAVTLHTLRLAPA